MLIRSTELYEQNIEPVVSGNQLMLFSIADEILENHVTKVLTN